MKVIMAADERHEPGQLSPLDMSRQDPMQSLQARPRQTR